MAFGVLTTNSIEEALARAGDGTGNKGHEAAVAAIEMAEVVAQLTRQATPRTSRMARARRRIHATGPARRRCRSSISGTSAGGDVDSAAETFFALQWPDADPPPDELRDFASALARDTVQRLDDDRSADRRHRRAVAARADGGPRSADPADGDLRAAARSRRRRRRSSSTKRSSWRARSATEESVKFINGMLDAIRKKIDAQR